MEWETVNHCPRPRTKVESRPMELIVDDSIALAFELLSPIRVCFLFSRAINRKVTYQFSPSINIEVPIPDGYREQLRYLEIIFGKHDAPYFGLDIENGKTLREVEEAGTNEAGTVVEEARALWGGWRGIEEYAREVFPVEEANNGLTWMKEEGSSQESGV